MVQGLRICPPQRGMGLVPGWGTKVSHAAGQLSVRAPTTKPVCSAACTLQLERSLALEKPVGHNQDPIEHNKQTTAFHYKALNKLGKKFFFNLIKCF